MEYSDLNVKYIAHSENSNGEEQTIKQHSEGRTPCGCVD